MITKEQQIQMENLEDGSFEASLDNAKTVMFGAYDIIGLTIVDNEVSVLFQDNSNDKFSHIFKGFNPLTKNGRNGIELLSEMFNVNFPGLHGTISNDKNYHWKK